MNLNTLLLVQSTVRRIAGKFDGFGLLGWAFDGRPASDTTGHNTSHRGGGAKGGAGARAVSAAGRAGAR